MKTDYSFGSSAIFFKTRRFPSPLPRGIGFIGNSYPEASPVMLPPPFFSSEGYLVNGYHEAGKASICKY
jgi:hypothetical protein